MLIVAAAMLIRPGGTLLGVRLFVPVSINTKSFGDAAHINSLLAPGTLLTRVRLRSNNMPDPESGVIPFETAEMCNVLIGPPPGRIFPDTFQLLAVSPAAST